MSGTGGIASGSPLRGVAAIAGIGETVPVRRSGRDIRELVVEAVLAALEDAGLEPEDVDGVVTDCLIMPRSVPRDWLAGQLGMSPRYEATLSLGGAGIVCSPLHAAAAIATGQAEVVLCYFGVDWGSRPGGPYAFHDIYPAKRAFEKPYGFNAQPIYFGVLARRYMHEYGLTEDALASVAMTHRHHAALKGTGQTRSELSFEDYLASPMIAEPLRQPDCCLITDGAGAFVMTSMERARDLRRPTVPVLGAGFASAPVTGDAVFTQSAHPLVVPGAREAADRALGQAGLDRKDVDFLEVYDCFSISCLMQVEDMGFCEKGEGAHLFREGAARLGGRLPVNTHGGFLAHSYRLGIEHVTEAVRQLRGQAGPVQVPGAEVGLVTGLSPPDYGVLALARGA